MKFVLKKIIKNFIIIKSSQFHATYILNIIRLQDFTDSILNVDAAPILNSHLLENKLIIFQKKKFFKNYKDAGITMERLCSKAGKKDIYQNLYNTMSQISIPPNNVNYKSDSIRSYKIMKL